MSGWETREKGMENNKRGWEGTRLKGQRRLEKRRVKGQRKTKTGGKPVGISVQSQQTAAGNVPVSPLTLHTEAALSQLMGSDGFCPRLTCTVP